MIAVCKAIGYNLWTKATFCTSRPALGKAPYLHAHSLESRRKSLTKWPHSGVNELEQCRHAQPCCRTAMSTQTEPHNQHILLVIAASFALKTHHPFLNQSLIRDSKHLCCSELHYVSFLCKDSVDLFSSGPNPVSEMVFYMLCAATYFQRGR